MSLTRELWEFARDEKGWFLLPLVLVVAVLAVVVDLEPDAAISPFDGRRAESWLTQARADETPVSSLTLAEVLASREATPRSFCFVSQDGHVTWESCDPRDLASVERACVACPSQAGMIRALARGARQEVWR